jgi:predicted DNA binding CopG/RHH family protein
MTGVVDWYCVVEDTMTEQSSPLEEAHRMVEWLNAELERQRLINSELRRAVAEMARTFQETLARANEAAEDGDIERVKRITFENRQAWQHYLQTIIEASKPKRDD